MKPIYIIQIGFSTLKDQKKQQANFFFIMGVGGGQELLTLKDLFHTAVHFTERQVLKDSVQTQPVDFKIWVRSS